MNQILTNIKELRDLTGAGFVDCKTALKENNNDIEKSIDYLRKKGLSKVSKKSSRQANEGAIGIYINENNTFMIEINTETDFAAKNEIFLNFIDKIGNSALDFQNIPNDSLDDFKKQIVDDKTITDHINDIIAKIGENIILRRFAYIKKDANTQIYTYTHNSYRKNVGKICVILKAEVKENNESSIKFGKNLCMHIAASKPMAIDIEKLDKTLVNKEKEVQTATIKSSGKPDNIVDKILNGKMKKFYSEVTLLNQIYILDNEKNIKEVISDFSSENSFKIIDYKLFVLGS